MKKKSIIALLMACSFAFGAATMTGCNLLPGADSGNDQTIGGNTGNNGNQNGSGDNTGGDNNQGGSDDNTGGDNNQGGSDDNTGGDNNQGGSDDNTGGDNNQGGSDDNTGGDNNQGGDKDDDKDPPAIVSVQSVALSSYAETLEIGGTETLAEQVTPSNATNKSVTWHSDNTAVATVDSNGKVTALSAGTANITATSTDGTNITSKPCAITVTAPVTPVNTYTVKFMSEGKQVALQTVEENSVVTAPSNITKDGYYLSGWFTGENTGSRYDFNQKVTGELTLYARWEKVSEELTYSYAGCECAAFEWGDANPAGATVEYKLSTASTYTTVDSALVRSSSTGGVARVDVVGLKKNSNYDFKITTSGNKVINVTGMAISAYDRSGYAHFNYTSGVGAYNDDGTPKSNAVIVYVNESNKNTVKATVNGKERTGIVSILQNAGTKTPLIVRVIGTVGAATWNHIEESTPNGSGGYNPITPDKVKGLKSTALAKQNWTQEDLISNGYNTLNTTVYSELKGLSSQIKWDSSKKEFDSCWNDCSISGVENVTVEGIGEDARIFQWGMTFKKSNSIEVRNLTFEDYTEDACSFEGSTGATELSSFTSKNIWIHHNTFEEGMNYWDVCNEQDKHDGDGSTDFKGVAGVTISYNVYNKTHKTGLIGGSNSHKTANVTFHHNAYNQCKSRLPLARQANMHMYNNYYNGTTSTDISLRASAYAFVENCYFSSTKSTNIELQKSDGENGHGAAKVVDCVFANKKVVTTGVDDSYLYIGYDRLATVTNTNIFSQTFDTDPSVFYYDSAKKETNVTNMLAAIEVPTEVPKLAGVQKRSGTVGGGGSTEGGGTEEHRHTYADTYTSAGASGHYKMATCEHTSEHTALEPHVYDSATDTTCNECGYVRTIGGGEGGEILSPVTYSADNCGLDENAVLSATENDLFVITSNGSHKLTTLLSAGGGTSAAANDQSGLAFSKCFLPSGSTGTVTVTAKRDITIVVYYTSSDSKFNTASQSKGGYLTCTVGTNVTTDSNTANKDGRTAYAVTINLNAGDVCEMKTSSNRFVFFGLVATPV